MSPKSKFYVVLCNFQLLFCPLCGERLEENSEMQHVEHCGATIQRLKDVVYYKHLREGVMEMIISTREGMSARELSRKTATDRKAKRLDLDFVLNGLIREGLIEVRRTGPWVGRPSLKYFPAVLS